MRTTIIAAVALLVLAGGPTFAAGEGGEEWKRLFDDLCSKTLVAMELPEGELKDLIQRCDKLKPAIDRLEEAPRKVYGKRLSMCRDLYRFVLESRQKKDK